MDTVTTQAGQVHFIDKFYVPGSAAEEFTKRMQKNRHFISQLPGLLRSEAFEQRDEAGNKTIITIASWENQDYLEKAKEAVMQEFKRDGFHPAEFYQRLNIKMERGLYQQLP